MTRQGAAAPPRGHCTPGPRHSRLRAVGGLGWRAAPWQARRSYAGDIGALYLRQHESQGRAQRLLGLEMPQPASPPCRRHAAPLPRDAATRESAMPPPRRPPCRSVATPTARRAGAGYTSGCASAGVRNTKKPRILISQSPGPGHGQAGLCAVAISVNLLYSVRLIWRSPSYTILLQ